MMAPGTGSRRVPLRQGGTDEAMVIPGLAAQFCQNFTWELLGNLVMFVGYRYACFAIFLSAFTSKPELCTTLSNTWETIQHVMFQHLRLILTICFTICLAGLRLLSTRYVSRYVWYVSAIFKVKPHFCIKVQNQGVASLPY